MLLRRFPFLNYLPIRAIQGQSLAKDAIYVGHTASFLIEEYPPHLRPASPANSFQDEKKFLGTSEPTAPKICLRYCVSQCLNF